MAKKKAKQSPGQSRPTAKRGAKTPAEPPPKLAPEVPAPEADASATKRNGGWREIEALREKRALRASLADVWDEDFDLDEEILAELDHTAEFFTTQESPEDEEAFDDDDEEVDEFFEDDEV